MNRTLLASVAVLALVLTGCSDDEGGTTTPTDSGSDVTTDSGTDSAPVDSATDSAPADSGADSATSDSGSDSATDSATTDSGLAAACTASGGTVASATCCLSTGDFPNTCTTGACGCAPSSSHSVQTCNCPSSKCWNGSTCM